MATHDYVIANGTGAAVRSDLNNALAAIVSNNSSSSEPGTTYAYQWWADTNANVLKIRNSSNDGWITLRELDGTMLIEDGSASTPGLAFADDVNTGIFSPAADQIGFATGGAERLEIGSSGDVQARRDRSNTAGDVALSVQPSDSSIHYGLRIDAANNNLNLDRASGTAANLLTIDSSGRVGVATTPEAWSGFDVLEVNEASIASSGSGDAFFAANAYYDGAWKYKDAGVARNIYMNADGIVFRTAASGSADAAITWTEVGRWREGGGLCFNGDTAAANALDDYEEGDWTPVLQGRTTNGTTTNNRTAVGKYTKIGRFVNVMCDIDATVSGGSGDMQISGLPFAAHSGPYVRFPGSVLFLRMPFSYSDVQLTPFINDSNSVIWISSNRSNTTSDIVDITANRTEVLVNITYMIS